MNEYKQKKEEFESSPAFKKIKAATTPKSKVKKDKGKGKEKAKKPSGPPPPVAPENLPKKPLTSFFLYRSKAEGSPKEVNNKWLALGAEGQAEWNKQAKELMDTYEKDMKEFQKTADGKKYLRLKAAYEKKQKE